MATVDEYTQLKKRVDNARQKADKAEGALEEVLRKLKKDFDCKTLTEAKHKLKQLKKEGSDLEAEFETAVKKFKKTWGDKIEDDED